MNRLIVVIGNSVRGNSKEGMVSLSSIKISRYFFSLKLLFLEFYPKVGV